MPEKSGWLELRQTQESGIKSAAAVARAESRMAIIVCHGMGQQVPFETIDGVATTLFKELKARVPEKRSHTPPPDGVEPSDTVLENTQTDKFGVTAVKKVGCQFVNLDGNILPRAEVTVTVDRIERTIHVYEAYWAPLTEGKINLFQVFSFCIEAGLNGLRFSSQKKFNRWIFGGFYPLKAGGWKTLLSFIAAVLIFAAFATINIITVSTTGAIFARAPGMFAVLPSLTLDLLPLSVFAVLAGLLLCVINFCKISVIRKGAVFFFDVSLWLGAIAAMFSATAMAVHVFTRAHFWNLAIHPLLLLIGGCAIWLATLTVSYIIRWFTLQYLGDVAIYLSSYRVSAFQECKEQIRDKVTKVGRVIYAYRNSTSKSQTNTHDDETEELVKVGPGFYYDELAVVGHSLGSVVAYDMLNSLQNSAKLLQEDLDIPKRTKLFLTFGSPLDKSAFVFRSQNTESGEIREALAAAVQPMICDYNNRAKRWYNIWSPSDIISGELNFYDRAPEPETAEPNERAVRNMVDRDADIPLLAHNQYWQNPLFKSILEAFAIGKEVVWETDNEDRWKTQ